MFHSPPTRFLCALAILLATRPSPAAGPRLVVQTGHSSAVSSVAFNPSGNLLASGGQDGVVKVWDPDTGSELLTLDAGGEEGRIDTLGFSPDRTREVVAAAGKGGTIRVWDLGQAEAGEGATGRPPELNGAARPVTLKGDEKDVYALAFGPSGGPGALASGGEGGLVRVWPADALKGGKGSAREFQVPLRRVLSLAWLKGGAVLVAGGDSALVLCDLESGAVRPVDDGEAVVTSLTTTVDGTRMAAGRADGRIRFWDVEDGRLVRPRDRIYSSGTFVLAVAFNADGSSLAVGGADRSAIVVDAKSFEEMSRLNGHAAHVNAVAFRPTAGSPNILATGSGDFGGDNTVRLWDVSGPRDQGKLLWAQPGHTGWAHCLTTSPDGQTLALGTIFNRRIELWDLASGTWSRVIRGDALWKSPDVPGRPPAKPTSPQRLPARSPLIAGGHLPPTPSAQSGPMRYSLRPMEAAATPHMRAAPMITPVEPMPGPGGARAGSRTRHTGTPDAKQQGYTPDSKQAFAAPAGKMLGVDPVVNHLPKFLPVNNPQPPGARNHSIWYDSIAFGRNGSLLVAPVAGNRVRVWDAVSGELLKGLSWPNPQVPDARLISVAVSADGSMVACGDEGGRILLWYPWAGQAGTWFGLSHGRPAHVHSLAFSPDGKTLASAGEGGQLFFWDTRTGICRQTVSAHGKAVTAVRFHPRGATLATAGADAVVKVWNARSYAVEKTLTDLKEPIDFLTFNADGTRLAAVGRRNVQVWDVDSGAPVFRCAGHSSRVTSAAFSADGSLLTGGFDGVVKVWDVDQSRTSDGNNRPRERCTLVTFEDGTWAVVDPSGRYDASNGGNVHGLHWVVGREPIGLGQLRERYFDPGLLAKHLGFNQQPLFPAGDLEDPGLFPGVKVDVPPRNDGAPHEAVIRLSDRGGGIGRVVIKLNNREIQEVSANTRGEADLRIPLTGEVSGNNVVEVIAYDKDGVLSSFGSRGSRITFSGPPTGIPRRPTKLWGVVVGVSKYREGSINLRYGSKDANDFAKMLEATQSAVLFQGGHRVTTLSTDASDASGYPSRQRIVEALTEAKQAEAQDVLIVYLAGHGIHYKNGDVDDYFYLTADARGTNLSDPAVRKQVAISATELADLVKAVPALKQVLILDTCGAGRALERLADQRDIPGSQIRALNRLQDRTGLFVLAGCTADAVSYEASRYAQGVLTYSLLLGVRGAALLENTQVDVDELFKFAIEEVPRLAQGIGGVQSPRVFRPNTGSFPIGLVDPQNYDRLPVLESERPWVLPSRFHNQDDDDDGLRLNRLVDELLRDASTRGPAIPAVFVEANEMPDSISCRLVGSYKVQGDRVSVTARVRVRGREVKNFTLIGPKNDLPGLARSIVESSRAAMQSSPGEGVR